jgi:hypothetical protein
MRILAGGRPTITETERTAVLGTLRFGVGSDQQTRTFT